MDTCVLCGDNLSLAGLPDTGGNIQFELTSGDIPQVWRAVVAGGPAAGATLIGFSGASNTNPVGARRLVVNTTHALKTAGTVAAITPNGKTPGLRTADTVTFSAAGLVGGDAGRCFKLNLDDNTLDGSTLGSWYRMASVNVGAQTATLEGSFGGDRTGFALALRSLYRVSNVVTVSTTEAHHLSSGQSVSISGSGGFADGTFTITVTDPVHFTFAQTGADDHAFAGSVQTAAAPTYTIADCSEAVGYDGVNHRLTIQANSYAWANGDTLQSGPNVYGGGGVGAFAIQKFTPHTAFAGTGMNVQVRGVQDADYAYGITADGSFRPNIRFGVGYLANYSHVGLSCEQADVSCVDGSADVPLFRVGRGDAGGSWSARVASSLMGAGSRYVFRFNGQDRVGIAQDGSYTLFPGVNATASGPSVGLNGSGVPEGGVTASMGSVYLRTFDGTAYIKSTATGNTGWKKFVAGPGISDSSTAVRLTLSDSSSTLGSAGHVFINPAAGNNIVRMADGTYQIDFLNGGEQILFNSARDTGIRRLAAGKIGIGNGTVGDAGGELAVGKISGITDTSVVTNLNADSVDAVHVNTLTGAKCLHSVDATHIAEMAGDCGTGSSVSDATTSAKGIVQLAGDLGGTAASPTVPALAAKAADSTVVHNTGNENVAGSKTFSSSIRLDPTGSTTSAPIEINFSSDFVSGNAFRFRLGDYNNGLQAGFGQRVQHWAYYGIDLCGNMHTDFSSSHRGFVSGGANDPSVTVCGTVVSSPVLRVRAATSQSADLFQMMASDDTTKLGYFDSGGNLFVPKVNLTGPGAGAFDWQPGDGTTPAAASGHVVGKYANNRLELSNNGDSYSRVMRESDFTLNTAGQGGLWLPVINQPASVTTFTSGLANRIYALQIYIPTRITMTRISAYVSTASASQSCDVGIYDLTGAALVRAGGFTTASVAAVTKTISATTLDRGTYFYAQTCSDTVATMAATANSTAMGAILNSAGSAVRAGTSSTTATAGVLPAAITLPLSGGLGLPILSFMEP